MKNRIKQSKEVYESLVAKLELNYEKQEARQLILMLMQSWLQLSKADIYLNKSIEISKNIWHKLNQAVDQLNRFVPVQYILGEVEFFNLKFKVNQSVLIPRPETEELILWIKQNLQSSPRQALDIGTGSGVLALGLKSVWNHAHVIGIDVSGSAIRVAEKNARLNQLEIEFFVMDFLSQDQRNRLPERFDLIVSNPPYVRLSEKQMMQRNVLDYEPHEALFVPDSNPLVFYQAIKTFAQERLTEDGALYCEVNEALGHEVVSLFETDFSSVELRKDMQGKDRMICVIK